MFLIAMISGVLTSACEPTSAPVTPSGDLEHNEIAAWQGEHDQRPASDERTGPKARSIAPVRAGVVSIVPPRTEPARPARQRPVDVSFERTDLINALQFLADAGKFNLIVESGLRGEVTATLKQVEPYDALVMIARSNGADASVERGIVYVAKSR